MEIIKTALIPTPLGNLYGSADLNGLYSLSFTKKEFLFEKNPILDQLSFELEQYFLGKLKIFTIPLIMRGTLFQSTVWKELLKIPYGETRSYREIAIKINNPRGSRAVGNANGKNPFVILIPCHRVLATRSLGGYSQGLNRKEWLLNHEMLWRGE